MSSLIISCSLNPDSRSYLLARAAEAALTAQQQQSQASAGSSACPVRLIDLRQVPLPLCDGTAEQSAACSSNVKVLADAVAAAGAVLLAVPVYNLNTSAAAKNLIEMTGAAW